MSMSLKKGLQGVVNDDVLIGPNRGKHGSTEGRTKCLDEEDNRNEGGTCMVHEGLRSGKADKTTKTNRGGTKCGQSIWWIGWREWFGRREWTTTFVPANYPLFVTHVGGCAVWWGWML